MWIYGRGGVVGPDLTKLHLLDRTSLTSITIKPGTVMPTDYDERLTKVEFDDLLAFLTRQGTLPAPPPARRRAAD